MKLPVKFQWPRLIGSPTSEGYYLSQWYSITLATWWLCQKDISHAVSHCPAFALHILRTCSCWNSPQQVGPLWTKCVSWLTQVGCGWKVLASASVSKDLGPVKQSSKNMKGLGATSCPINKWCRCCPDTHWRISEQFKCVHIDQSLNAMSFVLQTKARTDTTKLCMHHCRSLALLLVSGLCQVTFEVEWIQEQCMMVLPECHSVTRVLSLPNWLRPRCQESWPKRLTLISFRL